jgi:response regulator RpfG family c-di-GMP phosphodiesterase
LRRCKNTQFDPQIVDAFLEMIDQLGEEAFQQKYCSHATPNL